MLAALDEADEDNPDAKVEDIAAPERNARALGLHQLRAVDRVRDRLRNRQRSLAADAVLEGLTLDVLEDEVHDERADEHQPNRDGSGEGGMDTVMFVLLGTQFATAPCVLREEVVGACVARLVRQHHPRAFLRFLDTRLREQRLLTRVDGAGITRAGEFALSRLATRFSSRSELLAGSRSAP